MDLWSTLAAIALLAPTTPNVVPDMSSIFSRHQVIFTSTFNITKILVPADGSKYIQAESSELPSIFFTITDPHLEGGSCIYVLEDLAAYEILEGGRDSTADYGSGHDVYFGARDGVYKYDRDSLSAKKLGPFKDDIIQLQKAKGTDKIYFLTAQNKLFKLEREGVVRSKVANVVCATQFVLDTSNNIYYVQCGDQSLHIIKADGTIPDLNSFVEDLGEIQMLRPAFVMEDCIPLFGDGILYILYSNGTCEKNMFSLVEKPSAFSVDAALYLVVAKDGNIYEYNVMEVLLKSMFGLGTFWQQDINKVIMSVIGSSKDSLGFYKRWHQ